MGLLESKADSRGRILDGLKARLFLDKLCLLFLITLPIFCHATSEGDVLVTIMQKWGVRFPSWKAGEDPCSGSWEGVLCTNSGVTGLMLNATGLRGPIPPDIAQLTSLTVLDLGNNAISGPLPAEFAQLQSLQLLNLTVNPVNVPFPSVLLGIPSLVKLAIDNALLTGPFPVGVGTQLVNLEILQLGNNSLNGSLPAEVGKLSKLQELSLWGNDWGSELPPEWGGLASLQYLNLHDGNLHGGLPPTFSQLANLQRLNLKANLLSGHIPDSWRKLTSLQDLRLQKNFLSGSLPNWLLTLPALTYVDLIQNQLQNTLPSPLPTGNVQTLNLQCNYFTGFRPLIISSNLNLNDSVLRWNCFEDVTDSDAGRDCQRSISCDAFHKALGAGGCPPCPQLGPVGAPDPSTCVCGSPQASSKEKKSSFIGVALGGALGFVALLLVAVLSILYWKQQRDKRFRDTDVFSSSTTNPGDLESVSWKAPKDVQRYSFNELSKATNRFNDDHVIGVGGFGKVFSGKLSEGKAVAIKRASGTSSQGLAEFHNEVALLSRLHHRHLVRLEGFCEDNGMQLLVYEFMPNGNLHEYLSGKKHGKVLTWYKRLEIAVGVAQGLEYLHSFANPPVIHRDVKPSNILLDDNFVAKVADFGISKVTPEFDTHISTRPAGTAGFLDPEYFISRQLTTASDVYGFGVVLLELVTGQQAIDHSRSQYNIIEWARPRFQRGGVRQIIDPLMEEDYSEEVYTAMTEIALRCAEFDRRKRPTMKVVLSVLEPLLDQWPTSTGEAPFKGRSHFIESLRRSLSCSSKQISVLEQDLGSPRSASNATSDSGTETTSMAATLLPR